MKTILLVYLNERMTVSQANNWKVKKYCFRTEDDLKVGDIIKSRSYSTNMLVTDVIEKDHTYYNSVTGELSNEPNSTACYPIKTLVIRQEDSSVVYAQKIEQQP